ncbi:MAG TPA: hypothetical protein PKC91_04340 [Ignavibacteria bacterium]|nr:hypothetical protein [Ignavibacteria bacterium]
MIKGISKSKLFWAAIPSLIVLIISIWFDSLYQRVLNNVIGDNKLQLNHGVEVFNLWFYPILVYVIFVLCLIWLIRIISKSINDNRATETEIVKTIEKWSGTVDSIGTALPLIGAAVILFTVGLGKENQKLFFEFAIPFEIKSLFILAIAKLFESVFDEFEIQVQKIYDGINGGKTSKVPQDVKIEFVNFDQQTLNDVNNTINAWNETVRDMKDPVFESNLQKILKITGK